MMKKMKKFMTILACLAFILVGGVAFTACGPAPDVTFGAFSGNIRGHEVEVQASTWTEVQLGENEENLAGSYILSESTVLKQVNAETKAAMDNKDYVVCVTFAGKGRKISDAVVKSAKSETLPTFSGDDENEDAVPEETDLHSFITVDVDGQNKTTKKVLYISIDWDGEGDGEAVVYRFEIPAGITVTPTEA